MNPKVINPYTKLAIKHKESLDYIIANLPVTPAFDDLNAKLTDSFFTPDPDNPSLFDSAADILKTVLPNVYNGYVNGTPQTRRHAERSEASPAYSNYNQGDSSVAPLPQNDGGGYWRYNEKQMQLISRMLEGINAIPAESIGEFLSRMEEDIVSGSFTYAEQAPLLLAAVIGRSDSEYWLSQIATPAGWAVYLNPDNAINNARVAGWVAASMQGALLGYGLMKAPEIQVIDLLTANIGSVGLVAGKVIWGWVGR